MAKILVTGGAGAIGSNLCNTLARDHEVVALDNLSSGYRWLLDEKVKFVEGDIDHVHDLGLGDGFTHVFHLAAFFANQNSVDHPFEDLRVNIRGTLAVLEFAHRSRALERFVFASAGCSVYDKKNPLPLKEEYPITLLHDTPYQISKMTGEMYCNWFNAYYGMPTVAFRFFNSYGPGEVPGRYRNVIPNFIWWAMHGQTLPITGSGHETRDFIFVEDLVQGLTLGAFTPNISGEVFNLGTSVQTEVIDLASRINALTGNAAGVEYKPKRDWDKSDKKAADFGKAHKMLGFEPKTQIPEGLARVHEWFVKHRGQIEESQSLLAPEQRLVRA
ncbi:MAG: NAD-dependent epimerase/dehydratase family protein [Armatimonadetes bacterium]|nr:NAD-dependent epimerase/dehydratase family protein [Armatimonadota bacterium]